MWGQRKLDMDRRLSVCADLEYGCMKHSQTACKSTVPQVQHVCPELHSVNALHSNKKTVEHEKKNHQNENHQNTLSGCIFLQQV